ncbi:phage immunity repressor protein [Yersinia frederiksenii]|nr:phage immunity repressor protein [Yersinia frederiksenii]
MAESKCTYIFVVINYIQKKTSPIMSLDTMIDNKSVHQYFVSGDVSYSCDYLPIYRGHYGSI